MFVENTLTPTGCNPLGNKGRKPVLKVISGDSWTVSASLFAADGGPVSPDNSYVEFVLSENQFSPPLWTGTWNCGIQTYRNRAGFVRISIPRELTKTLRRGSYMFSVRVADKLKHMFNTQLAGNFLVEYMPTSEQHSIPYRDRTSECTSSGGRETVSSTTNTDGVLLVRDETDGTLHKVVAVRDPETGEVNLAIYQESITR